MAQYLLKYKTIDSLFDDVSDDLHKYDAEGLIDRSKLIKVVQRINSELGIKINKEKEIIVDIYKGKGELPDDFYYLNFALLCTKYKIKKEVPQGRHTENVELDICNFQPNPCLPYVCSNLHECTPYEIKEKRKTETIEIEQIDIISLKRSRGLRCTNNCINFHSNSSNEAMIEDGYISTNFNDGKLYINYIGLLEDEDGNLLVLDHPLINDYYEYALKQRIFENAILNGDETSQFNFQLLEARVRSAKNQAHNIINMPEYSELEEIWIANRQDFRRKYESIISDNVYTGYGISRY